MSQHGGGGSPPGVSQLEGFTKWLSGFGVNTGIVLAVIGLCLFAYLFSTTIVSSNAILSFAVASSPLWLPYILFFMWFESWMGYIQTDAKLKLGRVSLEILIPKDIFKSPLAMENILTQLFQKASPDNLLDTYWGGKHPPYFGLELISTEGNVRFIISTPEKKYKNYVENSFYSQYPGVEIRQLPVDYTAAVPWDPQKYGYMSIHLGKKKVGDKMGFPIKTYVDFGLDKDPKEEFKNDPMSTMIELLGSLGPGEHLWFQFLIRVHREENFGTGSLGTHKDWRDDIQAQIDTLMGRDKAEDEQGFGALRLTDAEKDRVKSLERAKTKFPFQVQIRAFYAAKLDNIDYDRIGQAITVFQATEDHGSNGIGYKWRADFDWNMWQDPSGKKRTHLKMEELEMYKKRVYEGHNSRDVGSILTTEEIATLFHLPGSAIKTPNLVRIPSARGEAPSNLPTG